MSLGWFEKTGYTFVESLKEGKEEEDTKKEPSFFISTTFITSKITQNIF